MLLARRMQSRHDVAERPCTRCGTTLPLDAFPPARRTLDGRSSWCRPCKLAATRKWRAGVRDEINARRRVHYEARPCDGCGLLLVPGRKDRRFCCVGCRVYHKQPGDPMAASWAVAHRGGHEARAASEASAARA